MISFKVSNADSKLIDKIADRAVALYPDVASRQHYDMDITAVHANGMPLDLKKLLDADNFNFGHDVLGIYRHLDRDDNSPTGGRLLDHFLPRCARKKA